MSFPDKMSESKDEAMQQAKPEVESVEQKA
jgi:hypothetical protein